MIQLSPKQIEYTKNANHRWNIKSGAVRSGKSFVDISNVIPERIISRKNESGLVVIAGVSRDTIERNVLQPMRDIYTVKRVSEINRSTNTVMLFGQKVYCIGAEKINQVGKIQGSSIKYCYGDEIAKWSNEFFEMLKSRMDKTCSCFDGACNPEFPTHWLKKFLDSDADIYLQRYRIFDNPFLPKVFVDSLCKEYEDSIYYDRYILGLCKRAEGAIYKKFADRPDKFLKSIKTEKDKQEIDRIIVGVDFGGNQSGHSFVATGFDRNLKTVSVLKSKRVMQKDFPDPIDSIVLDGLVCDFIAEVEKKYGTVSELYWDNAETVLGNTIRNAVAERFPHVIVRPAEKKAIKDRIDCTVRLMGAGRFFITEDCESLSTALSEAVWNSKVNQDERLDDGSSDIDSLDAFEYTIERYIGYLIK